MGHHFSSLPAESSHPQNAPIFRSPFTDGFSVIGTHANSECEGFELRFYDCLNAVGTIRGSEYCKLYFQDYKECTGKYKQLYRVNAMRQERWKQYWKGVGGLGPRVPMYSAEVPRHDSYSPECDYNLFD